MIKEFKVHSLEETERFAAKLAALLTPPDVITLEGDLGAGKTSFYTSTCESTWRYADSE